LTTIYGQDLPPLPEHWHTSACNCEPTVAYIRVSKINKKQKQRIMSPMIQFDEIERNAKMRNRKIVDIVFDLNKSGQDFDRDALNEVMDSIRSKQYRHISLWKWSRWGRNLRASLNMLDEVDKLGADIDSATEHFDRKTIMGEMGVSQMLVYAQFQARQIGETWRSVHKFRLENKLPHSGRKRFGYLYVTDDERDKHYEILDLEAEALEWAYLEYNKGISVRQIATKFNDWGLRTEFGGLWSYQAVGKMLDTGFGAGFLRCRSDEKKAEAKLQEKNFANTLKSYDLWLPGKQETVIDLDVWRDYMARRLEQAEVPPRARRATHAVSYLVVCAECSWRMSTHYGGRQRQHRWHCTNHAFHKGKSPSISNDDVLMLVKEWLGGKAQEDWVEKKARQKILRDAARKQDTSADEKQLGKVKKGIANFMLLIQDHQDADPAVLTQFMNKVQELEAERRSLQAKLDASGSTTQSEPSWIEMGKIVDNWDRFSGETHNRALRQSIGMIMVSPPSAPRLRSELRSRVRIIPAWEMDGWQSWFDARRQKSA
jgi:site-specific DNA recombinase